ncbi:uncharacterized protein (DUF2141 family) [Lewinella marina]|uniref:DUF2141 domain-containing protein n=1 Tax=Neolewinella marina TaxID=438751 RepID=UPI00143082EF|nr:DUF2141 domain-containing protein [Neolewinella marina]NJB86864.1 uncharacterized protein (DUF2141 family) [Neolewinella marina]
MRSLLLVLSLFFLAVAPPGGSPAATLVLEVANIRSSQGSLWVGIYESEEDFLNRERARLVRHPVRSTGSTRLAIDGLRVGKRYAIAVFHDENDNGELDTNLLGLPAEPYALSRPLQSWLRKPRFDEMCFVFSPDRALPPLRLR